MMHGSLAVSVLAISSRLCAASVEKSATVGKLGTLNSFVCFFVSACVCLCDGNESTYRPKVSRSDVEQICRIARNAKHRRQGEEPAKHLSPPGVFVVDILQRAILHQTEDENSLNVDRGKGRG